MRIAIATDAWAPQVNGVVTTLGHTRNELVLQGHEVLMIATEGPIGFIVRSYCLKRRLRFTTAYHTQFPEYLRARIPIPIALTTRLIRWFHRPATRTLVPTTSMRRILEERGFENVVLWTRGVQTGVFNTDDPISYELPKPIWLYTGRVAVEKNIEAFLDLELPGSKVIIGDGPDRERLAANYPDGQFLGYKFGRDLARHIAGADVFVFPSKTDTFGIVMLEAMACGLPIAAFPVTGPVDVVQNGVTGILSSDLGQACELAIKLDPEDCRRYAESRSWRSSTEQFASHLALQDFANTAVVPAGCRTESGRP